MNETVGNGLTVVVTDVDPEQLLAFVTVTVKVAAVLTFIVCVVAPVDQLYEANPDPAFNVAEPPAQNGMFPVIEGVGKN